MAKRKPGVICMSATPFTADNELDEHGFRAHLRRMVAENIGLYLGSPGSGEGHALSQDEMLRVYQIGMEECGGRVPVFANPPESRTATEMIQRMRLAISAGVDLVQIYAVDAGHAMRPTYEEQEAYYREILQSIDYPLAISVHIFSGYITPLKLIVSLCKEYKQLEAVNVSGASPGYLVALMDAVSPRVKVYNTMGHLAEGLILGTEACMLGQANVVPRLCNAVMDSFRDGDLAMYREMYATLYRFSNITDRWGSNPRWIKMGMKILDLPGAGGGRVRPPYLLPSQAEQDEMRDGMEAIGIHKIEGLSAA